MKQKKCGGDWPEKVWGRLERKRGGDEGEGGISGGDKEEK